MDFRIRINIGAEKALQRKFQMLQLKIRFFVNFYSHPIYVFVNIKYIYIFFFYSNIVIHFKILTNEKKKTLLKKVVAEFLSCSK